MEQLDDLIGNLLKTDSTSPPVEVSRQIVGAVLACLFPNLGEKKIKQEEVRRILHQQFSSMLQIKTPKETWNFLVEHPIQFLQKLPHLAVKINTAGLLDKTLPYILAAMIREGRLKYENEGSNAIILTFELADLPEWQQQMFKFYGVGPNTLSTNQKIKIKCLKAGASENASNELQMHQMAGEILKTGVPIPYFCKYISCSTLKEQLKQGAFPDWFKDLPQNTLEIFCAEYVPGEDFATYFYKSILQKIKKPCPLEFADLQWALFDTLKLLLPASNDDPTKRSLVYSENEKEIYKTAQNLDVELPNEVGKFLYKRLTALNKNGFYHNDLHPRNVVIYKTEQGWQAWIIDFGKAASTEQGNLGADLILPQQIWHYRTSTQLKNEEGKAKLEALENILQVAVKKCPDYLDQLKKSSTPVVSQILPTKLFSFSSSLTAEQITERLSTLTKYFASREMTLVYIHQALKNEKTPETVLKSCKAVLAALYSPPPTFLGSMKQEIALNKRLIESLKLSRQVELIVQNVFSQGKDSIKFPALLIALSQIDRMAVLQYIYEGCLSDQLLGPYTGAFTKINADVDEHLFTQAKSILSAPKKKPKK